MFIDNSKEFQLFIKDLSQQHSNIKDDDYNILIKFGNGVSYLINLLLMIFGYLFTE